MPFTRRDFVQTASVGAALGTLGEATPALASEVQDSTGGATKIIDLDDRVTFKRQLEHNIGPVVLMSTFLVPPDQVDNFLEGFKRQFAIMRKQPGLISHPATGAATECVLHRRVDSAGLPWSPRCRSTHKAGISSGT